jgi:hypothetical protein
VRSPAKKHVTRIRRYIPTQTYSSTPSANPWKATHLFRGVKAQTVHLDSLSGRRDRRLPIAVLVRLEVLDRAGAREYEKTYTDNLSAHGVRIKSRRVWHPGEQAEITSLNEEFSVGGEVVYCQKPGDERFFR